MIGELVHHLVVEHAVREAVGEPEVRQRTVGHRQVPELLVVAAVPRLVAFVVPQQGGRRAHAEVGPEERVQPAREPAVGDPEREPVRLAPIGVVGRGGMELVVGMQRFSPFDRRRSGAHSTVTFATSRRGGVIMEVQQLGHVVLKVRDRDRSVRFYTDVLGLKVAASMDAPPMTFFTLGNHHDLAVDGSGTRRRRTRPRTARGSFTSRSRSATPSTTCAAPRPISRRTGWRSP